ncbi:hypothetical protein [Pseudokineococcus sp. 1T1Z-3]|uniref:hypothetical protein n=1 Tax=Pseudokineococcus sp. 1T1Z-3 TaxID=3132745 RepID=UPI003097B3A6
MSARPLDAGELVAQARRLAGFDAGRGRPRTVDLRCAISRAYYALFHELTTRAAQVLVDGELSRPPSREAISAARWFSHTDMLTLCQAVLGQKGLRALRSLLVEAPDDLARVCETFVTLQSLRHLADCEHSFDVDRRSARSAALSADDAVQRLRRLRAGDDASYVRFLRLAGGAVRIAKDR